jgi:hypothetical protein
MICKLCNNSFGRQGGSFNKHLLKDHNIDNYKDYILLVDYNNIHPLCDCGCNEETTYFNNEFKKFKHGHNNFVKSIEIEKNRPIDEIIGLYNSGKTGQEISNLLNIEKSYIFKIIKKYSNTRDNSKCKLKYKIDDSVFEKIDSEESAYWLGFLYADGYLNKDKNSITLSLSDKDINILEKFKIFLKSDKNIRRNKNKSSKFVIENKKITNDLIDKGLFQAKTHIIKFPNLEDHLKRHFIRGYFDGDGCITYGKEINKNAIVSIVSNINFLNEIDNNIDVKFYYTKRHKYKDDKILTISSGGICNIMKIYSYLYKESSIYMDRKKNKFDKWFEYYFDNTNLSNKTLKIKNSLGLWGK